MTGQAVNAAEFVRAALMEAGYGHLAPHVGVNRVGDPTFLRGGLSVPPTRAETDALLRAFDLWHGPGPCQLTPVSRWEGYSPAFVDKVHRVWGEEKAP